MKKIPNFLQFVPLIWNELEIYLVPDPALKGRTDGIRKIWVNSEYPPDVRKFIILHEIGHIYLNYLNEKFGLIQPAVIKENEALCDVLAAVYLINRKGIKPREIFNYITVLHPSGEAKFRMHILRNMLLLAKKGGKP